MKIFKTKDILWLVVLVFNNIDRPIRMIPYG